MVLDINIHKNILIRILKDIYTDTSLGPLLGLKGGTALYFLYDLRRFSVDLDFDLLDENKKEEVFDKIKNILGKYGEIKDKKDKKSTLFFMLSYSEGSQNIKVEVNKRGFGSEYEVKEYLGISMLVMKPEDMFANKLVALTERSKKANRDLFDLYFFLDNNWNANKEIVEKRTRMAFDDYLKKCIESIEKIPERRMLSGLGDLLEEKTRIWAKGNLKKDLLFLLKLKLKEEEEK